MVDDAQLETLARLRFNPDGTDTLDALAAANPALARSIPDLLDQIGAAKSQLAVLGVMDVAATVDKRGECDRTALHFACSSSCLE